MDTVKQKVKETMENKINNGLSNFLDKYYEIINKTSNPALTDAIVCIAFIALIVGITILIKKLYFYCKYGKIIKYNKEKSVSEKSAPNNPQIIETNDPNIINPNQIEINEYNNSYQPKYLLTLHEKTQFNKIINWARSKNLYVFTKVRLADLIEPRNGQINFKSLFWKIQAKHIDFVICDKNIKVICVIELQDSSHYRPDRIERDLFVKEVLEACGYKFIQTHSITEDILAKITQQN